jgi:hypothetical protein
MAMAVVTVVLPGAFLLAHMLISFGCLTDRSSDSEFRARSICDPGWLSLLLIDTTWRRRAFTPRTTGSQR